MGGIPLLAEIAHEASEAGVDISQLAQQLAQQVAEGLWPRHVAFFMHFPSLFHHVYLIFYRVFSIFGSFMAFLMLFLRPFWKGKAHLQAASDAAEQLQRLLRPVQLEAAGRNGPRFGSAQWRKRMKKR